MSTSQTKGKLATRVTPHRFDYTICSRASIRAMEAEKSKRNTGTKHIIQMPTRPLYKQIQEQIVDSLVRNEWKPGEMIPSERQLALRYSVGISTVRAAIGELVVSGILIRTQGRGTHVAHQGARGALYRFLNLVGNDDVKKPFHREVISLKTAKADPRISGVLQFPAHERSLRTIKLKIKLSTNQSFVALAEIIVPNYLFPGLETVGVPDGAESLYAIYQANYGVNIIRVVERIYAVKAGTAVAKALDLETNDPVLEIHRIAYTFNDVPVEIRRTWVHTKHYHYLIAQGTSH